MKNVRTIRLGLVTFLVLGAACKGRGSDQAANAPATAVPSSISNQPTLYHTDEWIVGRQEGIDRNPSSSFLAGADRYQSGVLVIRLDTLRNRAQTGGPYEWARAESTVVRSVGAREQIAQTCKTGAALQYGQIAGLIPDTVTEQWTSPRLAWLFDTVSVKIRAIPPDSVLCILEMPD